MGAFSTCRVEADDATEHLAREGYDPVHGARPLKRFLQRALETPLSRQLISGDITDRTRVTVDFKKGGIGLRVEGGKEVRQRFQPNSNSG